MIQPDALLPTSEPEDLAPLSMEELRSIREGLQEVEFGYSYARRVVQGRLDVVLGLLDHDQESSTLSEISEAMSAHIKGPGLPRPTQGLLPPDWADDLLDELNMTISLDELGHLTDMDRGELAQVAERIAGIERELSQIRSQLHARIGRVQQEVIARYREGAGVEDLLS
ncbi:MAG: hypothetical protein ACR2OH_13335 [Microthrixaceae bacterium]